MSSTSGHFVVPGEIVFEVKDENEYCPGKGCYLLTGHLRASVAGFVYVKEEKEVCFGFLYFH